MSSLVEEESMTWLRRAPTWIWLIATGFALGALLALS
jgi:hypothetical protein